MTKFDIEKILKENVRFDDDLNEHLKDVNEQALWLQVALDEYLKDGNFDAFYACLEKVIEIRNISVRKMSKDLELSRSNIIKLLDGQTKTAPKVDTLVKIFDYLDFEIKILPKQA
ncbi:helix-turn-helix domain-containing protein [bacterium]|nr:helix-turn-helix domain-containing protein [bacterium]